MAITFEALWNLRNVVAFQREKVNLPVIIQNICNKAIEYSLITEIVHHKEQDLDKVCRSLPPSSNVVRLNVDAIVTNTFTTLAVVAENAFGEVLMTWTK